MSRPLFVFVGSVVALVLMFAFARSTGVASTTDIAYDEIVKFAVTATPPPPGSFAQDYAAITTPSQSAQAPAPKKRGLFGGFDPSSVAHALANGGDPGSVVGNAAQNTVNGARDASVDNMLDSLLGNAMKPMATALGRFTNGTLERHSFYGNWERVDDVVAHTATIDKCDKHQRILLDLAKKTYQIEDTTPHASTATTQSAPSHPSCDRGTPTPSAPGTGILRITSSTAGLAPVTLDGQQASGVKSTTTVAIDHATGSCRNGSTTVSTTEYDSRYPIAHAYCPLPAVYRHPTTPAEMATSNDAGGCKLKPAIAIGGAPAMMRGDRLAYYERFEMEPPAAGSDGEKHTIAFVTERGNIRTLGPSDESLFEIPQGFTQVP